MTSFQLLKYLVIIGFSIEAETAIVKAPQDVYSCAGRNVTLGWEYDNLADFLSASWTFSNETVTDATVLQKSGANDPSSPTSSPFLVEFIENGAIKLFDTSSINAGTYSFRVEYIMESTATDIVKVSIYDVPQNLTFQKVDSNNFTCLGSSSIPTVFRVTVNNVVSQETSPYTSRGNNELIECCYNGTAANCSTEEFDNVYGTLFCKLVQKPDSPPAPCSPWCLCYLLECLLSIFISLLIGGCIVVAILCCCCKDKCCIVTPRKCPCSSSKHNDDKSNSSVSQVKMDVKSSEKSDVAHKELSGNKSDGSDGTENWPLSTTVETTNETFPETKSLQSTKHDGYQVNNQVVQTEGSFPSSIKTGHSKVGPDDNQRPGDPEKNTAGSIREINNEFINTPRPLTKLPKIGSEESRQAPNMDDVEAKKPKKKKKKKKWKETKEDQIV